MRARLPLRSLLDEGRIPVADIARIAAREGMRPRPVYQAHKWFARRFATTARSLLTAAISPSTSKFWPSYYGKTTCRGISVLDPFMGGGVMLLEAARLGASVFGVDVEPVATAVSNFQGQLWDTPSLDEVLARLKASVAARVAPYYRSRDENGKSEILLHAFWVQVVSCASCGCTFDAHPKFLLAWDEHTQWVACRSCSSVLKTRATSKSVQCRCGVRTKLSHGHCERNAAVCPSCSHVERLIDVAARLGKPKFRLFAVETLPSGPEKRYPNSSRRIRTATDYDRRRYELARRELRRLAPELAAGPIPSEGRSDDRLIRYGYKDYGDMFNARQKLHLGLLAAELGKLDPPYRDALVMAFSDHLITNNMLCGYAGGWRRLSPLFSIRAYRHIARPVEINPWLEHNGRGTFPNAVRSVASAAESLRGSTEPTVTGLSRVVPAHRPSAWDVRCGDARRMAHIASRSIDLVLTDPPYFDYISYSELGHFFVPWLVHFGLIDAHHLGSFPEGQLASPRRTRAMAESFASNLAEAFVEIARVCKSDGRIAFTYQNLDGRGWSALATAMGRAGIIPITAFPMFGDGAAGLHKRGNSISWDCVVVCQPGGASIKIDLQDGTTGGNAFARLWVRKLEAAGYSLSPGDLKNFQHAGALVSAFRTALAGKEARGRTG